MKVIELLNKIANGEEVPKKIKFKGYEYRQSNGQFWCDETKMYLIDNCTSIYHLNDEVEIIEEPQEHKIPKKLPFYSLEKIQKAKNKNEWREERISLLEKRVNDYHSKINEIIDYMEEENENK